MLKMKGRVRVSLALGDQRIGLACWPRGALIYLPISMCKYYGQLQAANSTFEQAVGKKYTQLVLRNQYQCEALLFFPQKEETEA